jgi:aminoglycoside phosphotransferase (APT) family kinase protein
VRTLPLHGDFYPDNLVRTREGELYAVDTMLFARGPAEDDVARFLVGVDTLRTRIVLGDTLLPVGRLDEARRAFLDGYRSMRDIDTRLLAAGMARAALIRWAELRAAAALDRPAPLVALSRRRIDAFMRHRIAHALQTGGTLP